MTCKFAQNLDFSRIYFYDMKRHNNIAQGRLPADRHTDVFCKVSMTSPPGRSLAFNMLQLEIFP